jgi:sigma-B regulation protein RsbU (phosphoserine phosphatase)
MPLGMFREATFAEQEVELGADDMLILYSDGLSEAQDPNGQFFGEARLVALAPALRRLSAAAAGAVLLEEIERFLAGARPADDLSLAIVRRVA